MFRCLNKYKGEDIGVSYSKGSALNVPILDGSPWIYECKLVDAVSKGENTVYFGEIKNILVDDTISDVSYGKLGMEEIDPLIYSPGRYYKIGECIGLVGDSKKVFTQGG